MPRFDVAERIRPTVPLNIFKGLKLLPGSVNNWHRSNKSSRQYDTFIGVTYIPTGLSILLPAFEDDWSTMQKKKSITTEQRTLKTIIPEVNSIGVPQPDPWYENEDKKVRVPYYQAIDDYQGVGNILKVEHLTHVDGLYHKRAAVKLQTNNTHTDAANGNINRDFLGWAIKSNAYKYQRGQPLQMVFSSSRNTLAQDSAYNVPLWNNKVRQRSPARPGAMQSRDINNAWANAIALMLSRDLGIPSNKIGVFSGKKHWVVNANTLRKDYILCPEQIRTAPGKEHIYRRGSRALDVSEYCDVEQNGYLYLQEYISMACQRYLEEYESTHRLGSKKSTGYIRINEFQDLVLMCNKYSVMRLCIANLFNKANNTSDHSFISYFILYISYTPERVLVELSIELSGIFNRLNQREKQKNIQTSRHWRNRIYSSDKDIVSLRKEVISILKKLKV